MQTNRPLVSLCIVAVGLTGALSGQTFRVTAVTPTLNQNAASTAAPITLTFNEAVQPTTVNPKTVRVFGRWSGVVPGSLAIDASGKQVTFQPRRPYFPAEMVSIGVASGLQSKSNKALAGGFLSSFWARSAPASRRFKLVKTIPVRTNGEGFLQTYGVYAGDVDRDGSPDITVVNESSNDIRLLLNDGCGVFTSMALIKVPNERVSPSEGSDFNGDGWLDLVTGNADSKAMSVFLGDGKGGYRAPVTHPTGGRTHGIAVLDANGDGHADIAAPNQLKVAIFLNDGTGRFKQPSFFDTGGNGEDNLATVDANGDGKADLYVGNFGSKTVTCLLGDGTGKFKASATQACGGQPFGIAVGDVDGDGNVDAVTANWQSNTFGLIRGDGKGGLLKAVTYPVGKIPTAIDLGDLDGDGFLDCVVSSHKSANYTVYWNNRKGGFLSPPLILPSSKAASCATLVDFDRDGDTDIIATDEEVDEVRLYAHDGPSVATGAQPGTCEARLRINNLAGGAGFGSAPRVPVKLGQTAFMGVSGPNNTPASYVIGIGVAKSPGIRLPFGLLNLEPILLVMNGTTDRFGEALVPVLIPASLTPGSRAAVQALVSQTQGPLNLALTNPEVVILVR